MPDSPRDEDQPDHLFRWLESGLRRVSREFDGVVDEDVDRVGHRRLRILQLIPRAGIRQKELAERALVSKQAMAELIDALEADGLVERSPDVSDGRAWLVSRTQEGHRLNESADRAMRSVEAVLTKEVGVDAYAHFIAVLRTIGAEETP